MTHIERCAQALAKSKADLDVIDAALRPLEERRREALNRFISARNKLEAAERAIRPPPAPHYNDVHGIVGGKCGYRLGGPGYVW